MKKLSESRDMAPKQAELRYGFWRADMRPGGCIWGMKGCFEAWMGNLKPGREDLMAERAKTMPWNTD